MSFVSVDSDSGELRSVEYSPARVNTYASGRELVIPAYVHVRIGRCGTVHLSVSDARALLAALPGVLAEHEAVESSSVKAVA